MNEEKMMQQLKSKGVPENRLKDTLAIVALDELLGHKETRVIFNVDGSPLRYGREPGMKERDIIVPIIK